MQQLAIVQLAKIIYCEYTDEYDVSASDYSFLLAGITAGFI